jgi:hypothetical protein
MHKKEQNEQPKIAKHDFCSNRTQVHAKKTREQQKTLFALFLFQEQIENEKICVGQKFYNRLYLWFTKMVVQL